MDFSGADMIEPTKEDKEKFWSEILDVALEVPEEEMRNRVIRRLNLAAGRSSMPDFGLAENLRRRTSGALPGVGRSFDGWSAVDTASHREDPKSTRLNSSHDQIS